MWQTVLVAEAVQVGESWSLPEKCSPYSMESVLNE